MSLTMLAKAAARASVSLARAERRANSFASNMAKQVDYIKSRSTGFYTGITLLQQLDNLLAAQKNFAAGKGETGPGARSYIEIQRQILEIMNAINKYLLGSGSPGLDLNNYTAYKDKQGSSSSSGDIAGAQSTGGLP
jgi:hypothetical protein